jgi:hypothetical protein
MIFPLDLWDVSLWLAITATILIITWELLSPQHGKINIYINRKRLRNAALIFSLLFVATVGLRIASIIVAP